MATEVFSLPASTSLLAEVNKVGTPGRLKAQDGTIGDRLHQDKISDHNLDESGNTGTSSDPDNIDEVHARDIDSRGPWLPGWSMERIVQLILARCRAGLEKRLKYIIYRGRIWSASSGWVQKVYTGADQHNEHAHFSFRYGSGSGTSNPENITSGWGILAALEEENMAISDTDAEKVADKVWGRMFKRPDGPDARGNAETSAGAYQAYSDVQANRAADKVIAALAPLIKGVDVDEAAIAKAVLAGLPAATMGDAMISALKELPAETAAETVAQIRAAFAD